MHAENRTPGGFDVDRIGHWLVIAAGLLLCAGVLFHPVDGHSFYLNTNWHAGFLAELRAGNWYPRWLSTTNLGLGAPSFYFYAPLPFYVSAALDSLWPFSKGPAFGPVAAAVIAVILSGLAMFWLIRAIHGAVVALPVAVVFMAMPYHFAVDFWWRAAFGEIWAFVWLPLIALGILRQATGKAGGVWLAGCAAAGMILSHLPSFIIGACGLGAIAGIALIAGQLGHIDRPKALRVTARTSVALMFAVLATAIYWYPALTTAHLTVMSAYMTEGWYAYDNNFILHGMALPGNRMIQNVGTALLGTGLALAVLIILRGGTRSIVFAMAGTVFALSLFMTTSLSAVIYDLLSPLQRLQFPWRFLLLTEIALAVLLAQALSALGTARAHGIRERTGMVIVGAGLAVLLSLAMIIPGTMRPAYTTEDTVRLSNQLKGRADADEYRTRGTEAAYFYDVIHRRREAPSAPQFLGESVNAALAGFREKPGQLVLNQFWYPDLTVTERVTGRDLTTAPQPTTGLALVDVPAGQYDLSIQRKMLREVVTGLMISIVGVSMALAWGLMAYMSRRRSRHGAALEQVRTGESLRRLAA